MTMTMTQLNAEIWIRVKERVMVRVRIRVNARVEDLMGTLETVKAARHRVRARMMSCSTHTVSVAYHLVQCAMVCFGRRMEWGTRSLADKTRL